jgi:hypothetical protein
MPRRRLSRSASFPGLGVRVTKIMTFSSAIGPPP